MRKIMIAFCFVAVVAVYNLQAQSEPPAKQSDSAKVDAVREVVKTFFKNWEGKQATKSESLFLDKKMPVASVYHWRQGPEVTQSSAADFLAKAEKDPPKYLKLDGVDVDLEAPGMAVARVHFTGSGITGRGVFILFSDGKAWQIASIAFHQHFNW